MCVIPLRLVQVRVLYRFGLGRLVGTPDEPGELGV